MLMRARLQMNALFVRRKAMVAGFQRALRAVETEVHELVGAGVSILADESAQRRRQMERPAAGVRWGVDGIQYKAADIDYWVSRGGFFPGEPLAD